MKFLCGLVLMMLAAGCGKSPPPAAPTTQGAATQPAPKAAAVIDVAGEPVTFPVTSLDATDEGGTVRVVLAGNDGLPQPRQSFYFVANVEADTPADLPDQVWKWTRSVDQELDGAIGVFMEGNTLRFLPVEMTVSFSGTWPDLTVSIKGKLLRDGDETKPVPLTSTYSVRASASKR
jgi:hypothetical protein